MSAIDVDLLDNSSLRWYVQITSKTVLKYWYDLDNTCNFLKRTFYTMSLSIILHWQVILRDLIFYIHYNLCFRCFYRARDHFIDAFKLFLLNFVRLYFLHKYIWECKLKPKITKKKNHNPILSLFFSWSTHFVISCRDNINLFK